MTTSSEAQAPPLTVQRYLALLDGAGRKYNVNPGLLASIMETESEGEPGAVGPPTSQGSAEGAMQFMPATAAALHLINPFDIVKSVNAAARMLHEKFARGETVAQAVGEYGGRYGTPADNQYVQEVASRYNNFAAWTRQQRKTQLPESFHNLPPATPQMLASTVPSAATHNPDTTPATSVPPPEKLPGGDAPVGAPQLPPNVIGPSLALPAAAAGPLSGTMLQNFAVGTDKGLISALHEPLHLTNEGLQYVAKELPNTPSGILDKHLSDLGEFLKGKINNYYSAHGLGGKTSGEAGNVVGQLAGNYAAIRSGEGMLQGAAALTKGVPLVARGVQGVTDLLASDKGVKAAQSVGQKAIALGVRGAAQGAVAGAASTQKGGDVGQNALIGAASGAVLNPVAHGTISLGGKGAKIVGNIAKAVGSPQNDDPQAALHRAAAEVKTAFGGNIPKAVMDAKAAGPLATFFDTPTGKVIAKSLAKKPHLNDLLDQYIGERRQSITNSVLQRDFGDGFMVNGPIGPAVDRQIAHSNELGNQLQRTVAKDTTRVPIPADLAGTLAKKNGPFRPDLSASLKQARGLFAGEKIPKELKRIKQVGPIEGPKAVPINALQILRARLKAKLEDGLKYDPQNPVTNQTKDAYQAVHNLLMNSSDEFNAMMGHFQTAQQAKTALEIGDKALNRNMSATDLQTILDGKHPDYPSQMTTLQKQIIGHRLVDNIIDRVLGSNGSAQALAANLAKRTDLQQKLALVTDPDSVSQVFGKLGQVANYADTLTRLQPKNVPGLDQQEGLPTHVMRANALPAVLLGRPVEAAAKVGKGVMNWYEGQPDPLKDAGVFHLMTMPPNDAMFEIASAVPKPGVVKRNLAAAAGQVGQYGAGTAVGAELSLRGQAAAQAQATAKANAGAGAISPPASEAAPALPVASGAGATPPAFGALPIAPGKRSKPVPIAPVAPIAPPAPAYQLAPGSAPLTINGY